MFNIDDTIKIVRGQMKDKTGKVIDKIRNPAANTGLYTYIVYIKEKKQCFEYQSWEIEHAKV